MIDAPKAATLLPLNLQINPNTPGWIRNELSAHPFALSFADQTTIALPITGGSLKFSGVIAAIVALTCLASGFGAATRIGIRHSP